MVEGALTGLGIKLHVDGCELVCACREPASVVCKRGKQKMLSAAWDINIGSFPRQRQRWRGNAGLPQRAWRKRAQSAPGKRRKRSLQPDGPSPKGPSDVIQWGLFNGSPEPHRMKAIAISGFFPHHLSSPCLFLGCQKLFWKHRRKKNMKNFFTHDVRPIACTRPGHGSQRHNHWVVGTM